MSTLQYLWSYAFGSSDTLTCGALVGNNLANEEAVKDESFPQRPSMHELVDELSARKREEKKGEEVLDNEEVVNVDEFDNDNPDHSLNDAS